MGRRVLIGLDRDGTLIEDVEYLGRLDTWKEQVKILPGVIEALKKLRERDDLVLSVISNQAGVARGYFDVNRLVEITNYLKKIFKGENIIFDSWHCCPYVSNSYAVEKGINLDSTFVREGDDRKPGIGMLRSAAKKVSLELSDTIIYFVGDKETDVRTGLNANGKSILVHGNEKEVEKVRSLCNEDKYNGRVHTVENFLL